jgi:hypothetical protein
MFKLVGAGLPQLHDRPFLVVTELVIMGFFFAMRSCKETTPLKLGCCTKVVCFLGGIIFRDHQIRDVPQEDPGIHTAKKYDTTIFVDQKNHENMNLEGSGECLALISVR